ncbi:phosphatase PAP2 family protein [Flavobacterium cerinum]|uniref:Phosphatase PAP2 family protein n=1 Tax=Flavobacterium cerinum TaxID=2502784 RepID=A0ABY5IT46_9FLAO|nr:phosphatase PAP2 family protein [Flavobacterium cerinum]UUC45983.1 phosphatase PAP2 family protein [Flavobacterium cerinum]
MIQNTKKIKKIIVLITVVFWGSTFYGTTVSDTDLFLGSNPDTTDVVKKSDPVYQFSGKKMIIPAIFITYGLLSLMVEDIKNINNSTQFEVNEHTPKHIVYDNYTQYAPAAAVYALNLFGVEGKHNLRDRTIIYATSQLITGAVIMPVKYLVKEERPDKSNNLSFPSGHTATAFSSAHFMFREYEDKSLWLALSGYPLAAFTGIYRILNDKHWVGDVVAGAGIGILSTELAYWLFPKIDHLLKGKKEKVTTMVYPYYQSNTVGLGFIRKF